MAWIYNRTTDYNALDIADSQNNAQEFLDYFDGYMTLEAMAGILGNIYYECGGSINPGQMEHGRGGSTLYGYGMIQWTPGTVIINWATSHGGNWYDGAMQVYRIKCEGEGAEGAGGTWLPTTAYPYTWGQYCALLDVDRATKAYFYERERGTWNRRKACVQLQLRDIFQKIKNELTPTKRAAPPTLYHIAEQFTNQALCTGNKLLPS